MAAIGGAATAIGVVEVTWPGYSDSVYRGADGVGYVGRVRRIGGKEKRDGYEGRPAFNRNAIFVKKNEKLTLR